MSSRSKYLIKFAGVSVLAFVCFAQSTLAADFRYNKNQQNPNVSVAASENIKNLYTAGAQVVVEANTEKDVVAAASVLNINGTVGDDLIAASGNLFLKGNVNGSARIVGGNVNIISQSIGEDLLIAGGTVYISGSTVIKGDLIVAGGNISVDGTVQGNIKTAGGNVILNGIVLGNVEAIASKALTLGPGTDIKGSLSYKSPAELRKDPAAKIAGNVDYQILKKRNNFSAVFTAVALVKMLAVMAAALIFYWLLRKKLTEAVFSVSQNYWQNVGIGFIALLLVPAVAFALLFTVIGFYLTAFLFFGYILAILVSIIIGAAHFGSWLVAKIDKKEQKVDAINVVLGAVLFVLIAQIPIVGWLFSLIIMLSALGALLKRLNLLRKE